MVLKLTLYGEVKKSQVCLCTMKYMVTMTPPFLGEFWTGCTADFSCNLSNRLYTTKIDSHKHKNDKLEYNTLYQM